MCGINGFNFVNRKILKKMNDSLKHRGPDAEGTFSNQLISLGHRRLSIIDLSKKGNQPMKYSHRGKNAVMVYNGEIYNFLEIRKELLIKGYKFESGSDTEVILASYLEWGMDCVKKFNGMWAFCIYDSQKQILFLSRDRLGQKPLYYYFDTKRFIFSSEIKGILNHKINNKINKKAIDLYFSLGFIPSPYSIYDNIFKLEARQNLIFDLKTKKIVKEYYFNYPKYKPIKDKKKLIIEGKKLLEDSTKLRLISDVPLGAFLSGGIDSSTIVHEMKRNIKKDKLNTFSIGFEGKYDESAYIKIVKDLFNTKHHHKYFKKREFEKLLPKIFYFYDEPFSDPSMFPMVYLSQFARNKLTVSLSGDGGDEIFGGYPRHQMAAQMEVLRKFPKWVRKIGAKIMPRKFSKLKEGLRISLLEDLSQIYAKSRPEIYKPEIYKKITQEKMAMCLKLAQGNLTEAMILFDRYFQTMADNFLCKVDRASMANSLEVRSPFLDYRFIEYASKIPSEWKASKSKNKILMREIVSEFLPDKITKRGKTGFTPPIEKWLSGEKEINKMKKQLKELSERKIISKEWVQHYLKIFNKQDQISQNYKIRLFMFYKWWNFWKKEINNFV